MTLIEVTPQPPAPGEWETVGSLLRTFHQETWYTFTPGVFSTGSVGAGGISGVVNHIVPFPVGKRTFFDKIGFWIATTPVNPELQNGMTIRMYEDNGFGFPNADAPIQLNPEETIPTETPTPWDAGCKAKVVGLNQAGIDVTLDGPAMYWVEITYKGAENCAIVHRGLGPDSPGTTVAAWVPGYMGLPCYATGDRNPTHWTADAQGVGTLRSRYTLYAMIRAGVLEFPV